MFVWIFSFAQVNINKRILLIGGKTLPNYSPNPLFVDGFDSLKARLSKIDLHRSNWSSQNSANAPLCTFIGLAHMFGKDVLEE